MAVTPNARWDNSGTVIPGGDAEYVVGEQPIAEYDNWFNYNIVADVQAVIDDVINKFNANTILKADTDDTPAALTVGVNTIVGRAAGSISALSPSDVRTILGVEDGADVTDAVNVAAAGATMESLFDANTVLKADSDDTPIALTVVEQTLVGRITAGVITALTASQVRTLISVADGADVTGDNAPQSHASTHELGGGDFVDRSVVSGATVFSGTSPTTYTDLDLSAVVGSYSCLAAIAFASTDVRSFTIRTKGDAVDYSGDGNYPCGLQHGVGQPGKSLVLLCRTDSSGVIQWTSSAGVTVVAKVVWYL